MAVSEMQIEILLRPVIAEMERGFFKVADKLQRDQLAINVQEIEAGFRNGQKAIPSTIRSPQILQRRRPGTSRYSTGGAEHGTGKVE